MTLRIRNNARLRASNNAALRVLSYAAFRVLNYAALRVLACVTLALHAAVAAAAPTDASVSVRTAPLTQGTLAQTLTVYGTLAPRADAVATLTVARAVRIERVRVTAGEHVARGAALVEAATDPTAAAAFQRAQAAVAFARAELTRTQALYAQRLATNSQLGQARRNLADAQAQLDAQQRLGSGEARTVVRAPFDGVITRVDVQPGDRVAAGTALAQMARRARLRALLGVEPEDAFGLRPGMPVTLSSVFEPSRRLDARLTRVHGVINMQTRLVDAVVDLPLTPSGWPLPGLQVRGDITLSMYQGFVVPRSAALRDAQGAYLFQVAGGRARRVAVEIAAATDQAIGVRGNLDPTLPVVVLGNYELKDGMPVREAAR